MRTDAHKGRGALGNPPCRFDRERREPVTDDGWQDGWQEEGEPASCVRTTVEIDATRRVITRNHSPDIPFDRSINPYRGCEHGCIYCFARPTHAWLGLSPGIDFETRLFAKTDAARLLESELRRPGYRPAPIMLGTATDPYQPVERRFGITREVLQVLHAFRHPVAITTKSALVVRDLDLLASMAEHRLVAVGISVTTLDRGLARVMEPRASTPERRLRAIRMLAGAGVPVSVMAAPMIPFVNDHELERILEAAHAHGATGAGTVLLRLPLELAELFREWLIAHIPDRAERVMARLRDCHQGAVYTADFGTRMRGTGAYADLLARRFELACRRLGLASGSAATQALDCRQFCPPRGDPAQFSLF